MQGGSDQPNTHTQLETWEGLSLSRPFVTPTVNLNARVRVLELDVGTFRSNQYKPLCRILALSSEVVTRTQIY
jgi:hypothetical protein